MDGLQGLKGTGHEMRLGGALGPLASHAGAAPGNVLASSGHIHAWHVELIELGLGEHRIKRGPI